jgi:hypothetical protein
MALVGALTPLGKVAPKYWVKSVIAYTLGGSVSASAVGGLAGLMGSYVRVKNVGWLVSSFALVLAAQDFGWLHFKLPERKSQTEKVWAHEFGFVTASAMWGFHLGLGFTTYIRYGGFWVLTAAAFTIGQEKYGAILMLLYWLGRAMPVWMMPVMWRSPDSNDIIEAILSTRAIYSRADALTLIWSAGIVVIWILQGGGSSLITGHMK